MFVLIWVCNQCIFTKKMSNSKNLRKSVTNNHCQSPFHGQFQKRHVCLQFIRGSRSKFAKLAMMMIGVCEKFLEAIGKEKSICLRCFNDDSYPELNKKVA